MPVGSQANADLMDFISKNSFDQNMTSEVAIPLGFDMALASPTFDLMFRIYDSIEF